MTKLILILAAIALVATGCKKKSEGNGTEGAGNAANSQPAAPSSTLMPPFPLDSTKLVTTPSGLKYQIIEKGTGETPKPGDMVMAYYRGTLLDGTEFDGNFGKDFFTFPLGQGRVIRGWDEGFALFPVGTKAILIIPGDLAYGPAGAAGGKIPPNATLRFDVELVGIGAPSNQGSGY